MRKHLLFFLAAMLTQAADTYRPTATVKDIMITMVEPSADYIWESVATRLSSTGVVSRAPQTDKEWEELRRRTLMLMEATNLLAIPGRHVAKAGEKPKNPQTELEPDQIEALITKDPITWVNLAHGLHEATAKALAAIDAKDASGLVSAGGGIDRACENCHAKYWYRNPGRP